MNASHLGQLGRLLGSRRVVVRDGRAARLLAPLSEPGPAVDTS